MSQINAEVICRLVGEYVDEAELPTNRPFHRGEVPRTHVVAEYLDFWSEDDSFMEFTVLLKDGREINFVTYIQIR